MVRYFAHITPAGPVRSGQFLFAIGVLESPDKSMPIGMAFGAGRTESGLELWQLFIHGEDVPGRFVIVNWELRQGER
jgi:hypothetical protein